MNRQRPTIPLIPEMIDIRRAHTLVEGRANESLFLGWGVRLPGSLPW